MVKRCGAKHELADCVGNRLKLPRARPMHRLRNLRIAPRQIDDDGIATLIGEQEPSPLPALQALPGKAMLGVAQLFEAKPLVSFETVEHNRIAKLLELEVADWYEVPDVFQQLARKRAAEFLRQ